MKELKFVTPEPYEAPAILDIKPATVVFGQEEGVSGSPGEQPTNPGEEVEF